MTVIAEEPEVASSSDEAPVDVTVTIKGVYALLMHSDDLANPFNPFAKALKAITSKRGKTEEDLMNAANMEWWGGIYLSEAATIDTSGISASCSKVSRVIIPAKVLTAALAAGARKSKLGKDVSAGVLVLDDAPLIYRGSKDPNVLSKDMAFRYLAMVKVGKSRILRCRPRFEKDWSLTFTVSVQPDIIDPSLIRACAEAAGKYAGIGDWRPNCPHGGPFGRFIVTDCSM